MGPNSPRSHCCRGASISRQFSQVSPLTSNIGHLGFEREVFLKVVEGEEAAADYVWYHDDRRTSANIDKLLRESELTRGPQKRSFVREGSLNDLWTGRFHQVMF